MIHLMDRAVVNVLCVAVSPVLLVVPEVVLRARHDADILDADNGLVRGLTAKVLPGS